MKILNFDEYNQNFDIEKSIEISSHQNVNQIVKEMMGVSKESIEISNELVDYLNKEINNGKFKENIIKEKLPEHLKIDEIEEIFYKIKGETDIYNHKFIMNVTIFNCGDISDYVYNQILMNSLNMSIDTFIDNNKSFYRLNATLFLKDYKIPNKVLNVLTHECRHCWENINIYDDKDVNFESNKEYNELYNNATNYIVNDIEGISAGFKLVCKGIYKGDKKEISAFIQQDYDIISKLKYKEDVSKYLRDGEVHKALISVDDAIYVLEHNLDVRQQVKSILGINGKKLLDVLRKRKKKIETNLAKLNVMYKDLMNESFIIRQDKSEFEIYKL